MHGPDASRPASARRSHDPQGFGDTAACLRIRKACGKRSFQGKIRSHCATIASFPENHSRQLLGLGREIPEHAAVLVSSSPSTSRSKVLELAQLVIWLSMTVDRETEGQGPRLFNTAGGSATVPFLSLRLDPRWIIEIASAADQ